MATVFVSHSSADNTLAVRLAADLGALGHVVWVDQADLPAGASLAGSIQAGIAQSTAFLLLMSSSASTSRWVDLEWQAALERNIAEDSYRFLLCRADDCDVPLLLKGRKWIDLSTGSDYEAAIAAIHASLGPPEVPPALPAVWYFDDKQSSLDAFAEKHAGRFRVRTFSEIVDFLSALAQGRTSPDMAPDAVLLDLYCPRADADIASVEAAELSLIEFMRAEEELRTFVDAAWRPLGVDIVQAARQQYSAKQLPIIMHTQEGLFLLRDELVEELEGMGAGWLLKGRFSAETDRLVMERLVLRSDHAFGPGKPRVLIIDDNQKYIDSFIERQGEHFDIEQIHTEDEVLRTLGRLESEGRFPDVFVVDMYYPRGSDAAALERIDLANQKLREFAEIENRLRHAMQTSFEPLGLSALRQLRRLYAAEEVTALVYAQSGMLLLNDQNIQDIERLGGRWLLKGRYDARTEQTMILGELMRSGNCAW